jgi:glycosyltransferase involved in cell wall biosynthesis
MANKNYLISVIIANYNKEKFLDKSISSVLNQSYKNIELIIIDDCSTDSSWNIIKKFYKNDKRIKIFKTKKNSKSASIPRNLGISKAKGYYVAFLDSDDFWYLNKLDYQIDNIKDNELSYTAANYQEEYSLETSNLLLKIFRILLQK